MPIAITRFFDDMDALASVSRHLVQDKKLPAYIVRAYNDPEGLADALSGEGVNEATAKAYQTRMAKGGAVLLVMADYTPLGVAQITRDALAASPAVDMGDLVEEAKVKASATSRLSVLQGTPLMMTRRAHDPYRTAYHMADKPVPLLIDKQKGPAPLVPLHGRMASWPIGLLVSSKVRFGRFPFGLLVPGNRYMAKFPFGHIVPGHKFMAKFPFAHIVPGHKHMAKFPFGHLVPSHKRYGRFPFDLLVPNHRRMANWPFPLLINGNPHKHPDLPPRRFWANKPIGHLVSSSRRYGRFPFGLLVPGNKYMAKFPIGHLVPGNKYMANWIFPHTRAAAS